MKIAIAQINPIVGDIEYNKTLILSNIELAKKQGADLVVFPEQALVGYPLNDLVYEESFLDLQAPAIEDIRKATDNIAVCFGCVEQDKTKLFHDRSTVRYNAAIVLQNRETIATVRKTLLPNYDVFHEERYYTPSETVEPVSLSIGGKTRTIGFEICEDLWDDIYPIKVSEELVKKGAEILINLSASPFEIDKYYGRERLVQKYSKSLNVPFIYCNMVGGQDELIFDGNSFVYNANGEMSYHMRGFENDLQVIDTENLPKINIPKRDEYELLFKALVRGVKDYFFKNGLKKAVLGLSGGVDSALVAALAAEAIGAENVLAISMPSKYSSDHSKDDAKLLAENYGMAYKTCPIEGLHKGFETQYMHWFPNETVGLTDENIQARIRGTILMAHSNQEGRLLLTTGNKTEIALGYCTLYGDMNGALAVIGDLSKHRVFELCRYINQKYGNDIIPRNIIEKVPSAELRPDQFDPFDYEKVSPLVDLMVEGRKSKEEVIAMGYDPETVTDLYKKLYFNEFKRFQAAIILKVTSKSFGYGRLFPITNRFRG